VNDRNARSGRAGDHAITGLENESSELDHP
jgi:hypothetical protein